MKCVSSDDVAVKFQHAEEAKRRMVAARRPNEDLNNFISMKARLLEGPARSASPTEQLRKMLPSIADHSEDAHADGELHETRRRSTLKGVDRAKRDEMIDAIFAPLPPDRQWTPLPQLADA